MSEARLKEWADGLREIADFAEQRPELFENGTYGERFNLFAYSPEEMTRKTVMLGTSKKSAVGGYYCMTRSFGPHKVELNIQRDKFCERVQTGTRIVEKPDPKKLEKVPTVKVEEPVYEWICPDSVLSHKTIIKENK
jgi:hypothetical protein